MGVSARVVEREQISPTNFSLWWQPIKAEWIVASSNLTHDKFKSSSDFNPPSTCHPRVLCASAPSPSVRESFGDRASCRGFLPDEHTEVCKSARTIVRCCIRDQNHPSCTAREEFPDSRAAANTSALNLLRKHTSAWRPHDIATDKVCLLRYCPGTNSTGRGLYCRASSPAGRCSSLSQTAA